MSETQGAPSGREYGRIVFVVGCVLALILAAAVLPAFTDSFGQAPIESLLPTQGSQPGGDGGGLGALNPGSETGVGGLEGDGDGGLRSQSAEIHFVVESTEPAYWRTGAYTTYTGSGWTRSDETNAYEGQLDTEGLVDQTVSYRVRLNRSATALPTVWRPQSIRSDATLRVTDQRAIRTDEPLTPGDTFQASSATPPRDPSILSAAGRDYPVSIEDRYTQLPVETSERLDGFTDQVVGDADTPYAKAKRIEEWLEANKGYSLSVSQPSGDTVASDFVWEMEQGYCEYFATAMVTMLRTQDVPARYVVGYSTGQPTGDNTYTVRGMNAHAWVEVYFPEVGWVRFDPTPGQARLNAERQALERQRPDAGSYDHSEEGSPGETFRSSPEEPGTDDPVPTDPPTTPSTPQTPTDPPENPDDPTEPPDDTEPETYNITLSGPAVPGSNVTVRVTRDGEPARGVTVLFNDESVGVTGYDGTVVGEVPFAERLTVRVRESTVDGPIADVASPGRADRLFALATPTTAAQQRADANESDGERTFTVETGATLSLSGTVATDQTVAMTVTVAGRAIEGATVTLDGQPVGTTDRAGRIDVTLPEEPGAVRLAAHRDPVTGNRTLQLEQLEMDVDPQFPVALPWTGVTTTARLGNDTVAGVPVFVDGEQVGTTGINGSVTATLPLADSVTLAIERYGQRRTATVGGLWTNLVAIVGGTTLLVVGGVVVLRRRRLTVGTMLDGLVDGALALPRRLVGALITAADALVSVGAWASESVARGVDALRAFLAGELSRAALLAAFRDWLTASAQGARSTVDPWYGETESAEPAVDDRPSAAYLTIREGWDQFLATLSISDPATKTPGELAEYAIERDGLPASAVDRLVEAFRDVEYGARSPDDRLQTVEQAVERLRPSAREEDED